MKQNYTHKHFELVKTVGIKTLLLLILTVFSAGAFKAQNTYTFTNASATGSVGPTQAQINTAYFGTNLSGSVIVPTGTPGIQTWTVPSTMGYRIEARGAQGYGSYGGRGAVIAGDYTLTAGTVLKILVGQKAETPVNTGAYNQYGGGGGSFVTSISNSAFIIAGGGGGSFATSFQANSDGTVVTSGNSGANATDIGSGGASGSGGSGSGSADGGGGLLSNGVGFSAPGIAFINGGTGGTYLGYGLGGFGGGAGTSSYNDTRGGGGGGYSGGGGAHTAGVGAPQGGGGGSYNGGVNQTNTAGGNLGQGLVIISELCNITIRSSGSNSVTPSICSGTSLTLTTNAVSNYTWSNGNTTSNTIVVTPTSSQTYSIIGTSSLGCVAAGSISVTVNAGLPVLTITNTPNTLCLGKSATLTAGGALSYAWAGGATTVTNGVTFFPTATTAYTVTGTNGCGQSTATTTITIAPLVVTAATSATLVCQGTAVTLSAVSSVNGYTWYPANIALNPVVVAPTVNTIYTVSASDGTCVGTATVAVSTKTIPVMNVVVSNSNVCDGSVVTLTASGALSYTWTNLASNNATVSATPVGATNYQVYGTNALGCVSSGAQIVLTMSAPVMSITASKTIACVGGSVNLTASGANSYTWTNGPNTAGNLVNPSTLTTYSVIGTGTNGCSSQTNITISTLATNLAVSAATANICEGGTTTITASGANTYTWTGTPSFNGSAMVSPAATTVYSATANTTITGLSCSSTATILITVFNTPTVTVVASKTLVCKNDKAITLTGGGASTYTWSANTGTTTPSASVSVHPTILNNNVYSVTGTDVNGCISSGSVIVKVNACTGIEELNGTATNLSIYPNPSNGEFTISADSEINLKLVSELGQIIKTIRLSQENNFKASVTNLANGVYFIVGQNNAGKINQKVIVSK